MEYRVLLFEPKKKGIPCFHLRARDSRNNLNIKPYFGILIVKGESNFSAIHEIVTEVDWYDSYNQNKHLSWYSWLPYCGGGRAYRRSLRQVRTEN